MSTPQHVGSAATPQSLSRRATPGVGNLIVGLERRFFELKPQYVERVGDCDISNHVVAVNNAGMPVSVRAVRRVPWRIRHWLPRHCLRWLERLPKPQHECRRYQKRLNRMMKKIKEGRQPVAIIIHGGMDDPYNSLKNCAAALGGIHRCYYPIFVVWDSYLGALPEQLLLVRSGHYSPWGVIQGLFLLLGDIFSGIGLLPVTAFSQIRSLYTGSRFADDTSARIANTVRGVPGGVQVAPATYTRKSLSWWAPLLFLRWLVLTVIRAVTAFLLDVLAPPLWQNLKRRSRAMFRAPQEFESLVAGPEAVPTGQSYEPARGAMAVLADHLVDAIGAKSGSPIKVTLIVHSMGSMIANEFLAHVGDRLLFQDIVYMAPACSVRDFVAAVTPVLKREEGANAYVLTLHPKAEANEKMDGVCSHAELCWSGSSGSWIRHQPIWIGLSASSTT